MKLLKIFAPLVLAQCCDAGPLVAAIGWLAGTIAEAAMPAAYIGEAGYAANAAIMGSRIATAFGFGESAIFYDQYIVVNGVLYWGSTAAGIGVLGGAAAGGAVAGLHKVSDEKQSKSIMSEISASSVASVSRASISSVESVSKASVSWSKVEKKLSSKLMVSEANARASVESLMDAPVVHNTAKDPFNFKSTGKGQGPTPTASQPAAKTPAVTTPAAPRPPATTTIGTPPGTPVSTLPIDKRPANEIPSGIPEYNWRMCQYDMITMGNNKQNMTVDQPLPQSILVGNIPPTCMVLVNYLIGNPTFGPHPVVMGADKLQWNNIDQEVISLIRQGFGVDPVNTTMIASATGKR